MKADAVRVKLRAQQHSKAHGVAVGAHQRHRKRGSATQFGERGGQPARRPATHGEAHAAQVQHRREFAAAVLLNPTRVSDVRATADALAAAYGGLTLTELESRWRAAFAEPDVEMRVTLTPNDSLYGSYQWSLPMISAPQAWDTSTGNANVIIAVVDTGVDATHPDLNGKITTGANAGYNFVANNTNTTDDHSHGTFVSGIAAANSNNAQGMAGACWACKIMPVKVLDSTGSGSSFNVAQGIDWARTHGADVINLSLGGGGTASLQTAVDNAWNAGVIVVAATGNDNGPVLYPAAYSNSIAVGAVDQSGARSSFSNFGPEIDIVAPGNNVLGTLCNCNGNSGGYGTGGGTSFSTPYVSGVVGLLIASGITDKTEIRNRLLNTATDVGAAGFDNLYGWGRVNAGAAIAVNDTTPPTSAITSPANGASVNGIVTANANATDNVGVAIVRFYVDNIYIGYDVTAPYSRAFDSTAFTNGPHTLHARAYDAANNQTDATRSITIANGDSGPPTANITSPANGATLNGAVNIQVNATDDTGVTIVRFWVDGTYIGYDTSAPYSRMWNTTQFSNGTHVIKARAYDGSGNGTDSIITVTVINPDNDPPQISITSPSNGATVSGIVDILTNATDTQGVKIVRFWVDGTYIGYDQNGPFNRAWNTTLFSNGTHTIKAKVYDWADNAVETTITVTVSN